MITGNKAFKMTEEIARWAFEVRCRTNQEMTIAFTNPTAGPWKRVEATNSHGVVGEVFRFPRDSQRPDILGVDDVARKVYIIEAKPNLEQLLASKQLPKTVAVYEDMRTTLTGLGGNPYWGDRAKYDYEFGLLWGSVKPHIPSEIQRLFDEHHAELVRFVSDPPTNIFGIETFWDVTSEQLDCRYLFAQKDRPLKQLEHFHDSV
jgi:hypothetical protein